MSYMAEKIERLEAELADMDGFIIKQAEELKKALRKLADWQRHGVKVTEDCETCEDGLMCVGGPHDHDDGCRCPDCGGTGKKLRDGVRDLLTTYIIPAEWLEADDGA